MSEPDALLEVRSPGGAAFQDLGRPGLERTGLGRGGALDRFSAQVANILVGNPRDAPFIEVAFTSAEFLVLRETVVAAVAPENVLSVDGVRKADMNPVPVWPGQRLTVSPPPRGARSAFAVRGLVPPRSLAGSAAPDPVVGFTTALHTRQRLEARGLPAPLRGGARGALLWRLGFGPRPVPPILDIPITAGPDHDEVDGGISALDGLEFSIAEDSNAIGMRLRGPAPRRNTAREHLSRGVPVGALELTPSGELIVLHRSRYITAGYPVIAVASLTGLDALGQALPGDRIALRASSVEEVSRSFLEEQVYLDDLEARVRRAFS